MVMIHDLVDRINN